MSSYRNIIGEFRRAKFRDTAEFINEIISNDWPEYLKNSFSEASCYFASRTEHFQIAICGLFQSGKSLTVNMMTGGSEISPVSSTSGIRTSACNIYFYGSDTESAKIIWLSDSELAQRLSSLLKNNEININADNLWASSTTRMIEREFVSLWNSTDDYEALEYLALLISWMHRLPELRRNYSAFMKLNEATKLSSAPDDERQHWGHILRYFADIKDINAFINNLRQIFPIDKVMYIFIKRITAEIKSEWLQRNNICIVDTPGLNVNSQDSRNADEAITNADALIYVFGGTHDKEPAESEKNFILNLKRKIKNCPVVFAVNFPGKPKTDILASIKSLITLGGYNEKSIISYNALLSYRAAQGNRLLAGELDEKTAGSLMIKAEQNGENVSSPSEAWKLLVYDELYNFSRTEANKILRDGLCENSINILKNFSGNNNFIIGNIIDDVSKDAHKILLTSQVITPIRIRLQELSGQLLNFKRSLRGNFEEHLSKFYTFTKRKKSEFQNVINSSWRTSIATEMFDKVRDIIPDIAGLIAQLSTEPDSFDFNSVWSALLNQSFYKWSKMFMDKGAGTSARILDIAGERFFEPDIDDDFLSAIWKMKNVGSNIIFTIILYDIVNHPIPVHSDQNIFSNYIYPLIKEGSLEALSSRYYTRYIQEKISWNPFVDHKKNMNEARYNLKLDIQSRLYKFFRKIQTEAISYLASSSNGLPMKLYERVENYVNDVIINFKQYILSIKEQELSKLDLIIMRISNYINECN